MTSPAIALWRRMASRAMKRFRKGQVVVFRKEKHSTHPGPRAHNVRPAHRGDMYDYLVDKYWIIVEIEGDVLVLKTPKGKVHRIPANDPHLHRLRLHERLWLRFRSPERLNALTRQTS